MMLIGEEKQVFDSLESKQSSSGEFYHNFRKIHLSLELCMTFIITLLSVLLFLWGHKDRTIIQTGAEEYFNHFVFIPAITHISLYIITYIFINDNYIGNSVSDNVKDIIINISFVLFTFSVTVFYQFIPMVYASFIIPIIVAAVYGKYKIVILNSALVIISEFISVFMIQYDEDRILTTYYGVNILIAALLILPCIMFSFFGAKYVKHRQWLLQKSEDTIAKLREKLNTDNITGVYSIAELNKYCRNLRKTGANTKFSVIYLAVDEFMNINKSFGYAYGDKVLGMLGELMLNNPSLISMRYGGAEFVLIVMDRNPKETLSLIDELRQEFILKCQENLNNSHINFIAGVTAGDIYIQPEFMMARANAAMNYARMKGEKTCIFNPKNMQLDEKRFIN